MRTQLLLLASVAILVPLALWLAGGSALRGQIVARLASPGPTDVETLELACAVGHMACMEDCRTIEDKTDCQAACYRAYAKCIRAIPYPGLNACPAASGDRSSQ